MIFHNLFSILNSLYPTCESEKNILTYFFSGVTESSIINDGENELPMAIDSNSADLVGQKRYLPSSEFLQQSKTNFPPFSFYVFKKRLFLISM